VRAGSGRGLHGGDTERGFVHTSASGGELDREGAGCGHAVGGRVLVHGAYSARRAHGRARRRAFGCGRLANSACCVRASSPSGWRWNLVGAVTGGSSACGTV
jgi:hypothetical protein